MKQLRVASPADLTNQYVLYNEELHLVENEYQFSVTSMLILLISPLQCTTILSSSDSDIDGVLDNYTECINTGSK